MESSLLYMPAQAVAMEEDNGNVIPSGWRDDMALICQESKEVPWETGHLVSQ
jgi:hypothetical protein